VIKMVLAMRHSLLPRTLHVDEPSQHVDWSTGALRLLTQPQPWPADGRPRRAGVSSFGVSGTNAHVVLEQAPAQPPAPLPTAEPAIIPWVLSARSEAAIRAQGRRLASHVTAHPDVRGADIGFTLAASRSAFEQRAVVVGRDAREAAAGLRSLADGDAAAQVVTGTADVRGKTVFVFGGQGAHWEGMTTELLDESRVFADRIADCEAALAPFVDWSVTSVLRGAAGSLPLTQVDVVQPVLWAVMVALAAVWEAYGVRADAVIGHSQGEIAAACVAGGLSLDDGARVVALRSQAIGHVLGSRGGMLSVGLPADAAEAHLKRWPGRVSLAAENGARSVVVAGDGAALDGLAAELAAQGVRTRRVPVDYASHSAQVDALRPRLLDALSPIAPVECQIPMMSSVTGAWLAVGLDAGYWFANLRRPVRFATAVRELTATGHAAFIEVTPHAVLAMSIQETLEDIGEPWVVTGTLRRGDGGLRRFVTSAAELYVRGVPVDWQAPLAGCAAHTVDVPTYAFQRQRYWLDAAPAADQVGSAGLCSAGHPLLDAVVELPDSGGVVLTGRLSVRRQPWLADHVLLGRTLLPGAAFVELAVRAGDEVGCDVVEELTQQAPLVLPEQREVTIRVLVGAAGDAGSRPLSVYSRPEDSSAGGWTLHATGTLAAGAPLPGFDLGSWPPAGAERVDLDGVYDDLARLGFGYGPTFRGMRAAWRRGGEVFAEVALPDDACAGAASFGLHPALLDGALGTVDFLADGGPQALTETTIPFAWNRFSLHASGASALRVRARRAAGANSAELAIADVRGLPIATVESLRTRPVTAQQLGGGRAARSLYRIAWNPAAAPAAMPAPDRWAVLGADPLGLGLPAYPDLETLLRADGPTDVVLLPCVPADGPVAGDAGGDMPAAVRAAVHAALAAIQAWLAEPRCASSRLVVLTRHAVALSGPPDLAQAPVWGLMRAAQAENPGRLLLVDVDGTDESRRALSAVVATAEPESAVRSGEIWVPRLQRVTATGAAPAWNPDGTVLITGGAGLLGGLLARHLVDTCGVRHLLLASRQGPDAPGAAALRADLTALGASVTLLACDVADRAELAGLLAQVPAEHPLTAVVHAAGLMNGATLGSLTLRQVDTVLRPKVDAAWYLHELTLEQDLAAFVLYSSVGGMVLPAGQANYAAANVFLDALAQHRQASGRPATSLAWGPWEGTEEQVDLSRLRRSGILPFTAADGLAQFDAALGAPDAVLVPVRLDEDLLRGQVGPPALLRALARPAAGVRPGVGAPDPASLQEALARQPASERKQTVLGLVRRHAAAVLGYDTPRAVDPVTGFTDLGLDSLAGVELRNRLAAATALRLPATLIFDYPNATRVTEHVLAELFPDAGPGQPEPEPGADRIAAIKDMDVTDLVRAAFTQAGQAPGHREGDL
jgi:malonyl CoA-acyl carrier protein transacylase/NADP-dependent 3-hydroxy acid dehydrogenase YdfG